MRAALSTVVLVFICSLAHAQESVRVTQDPERNDRPSLEGRTFRHPDPTVIRQGMKQAVR